MQFLLIFCEQSIFHQPTRIAGAEDELNCTINPSSKKNISCNSAFRGRYSIIWRKTKKTITGKDTHQSHALAVCNIRWQKEKKTAAQVTLFLTVGCMQLLYLRSTYYTVHNGENGNCFISSWHPAAGGCPVYMFCDSGSVDSCKKNSEEKKKKHLT